MLVWGKYILVTAVCPFSKWVEVGVLPDRHSSTVARWVHAELLCRYGLPWVIRLDHGTELRGAFEVYLQDVWAVHSVILPQQPRSNRLV